MNIETEYPGKQMTKDTAQGTDWYTYTFNDLTKVNMLFIVNGEQSKELTRNTGEYWYANNRWYTKNPDSLDEPERTDFRRVDLFCDNDALLRRGHREQRALLGRQPGGQPGQRPGVEGRLPGLD